MEGRGDGTVVARQLPIAIVRVTCSRRKPRSDALNIKTSKLKVREHRERLYAQGMRPIQIWVPDVRTPAFRTEAHRQSTAVAQSAHAADDQAFIDAVSNGLDE